MRMLDVLRTSSPICKAMVWQINNPLQQSTAQGSRCGQHRRYVAVLLKAEEHGGRTNAIWG
jgi:hypothetical protein